MNNRYLVGIPALLAAALLASCGGAGGAGGIVSTAGGGGGGIGGTGLTSSGTIDGFGSVFVNGVEFETDNAEILVDGRVVGEDSLGLGMVVLVTGTIDDTGTKGEASRIVFDDEVQGPVTALQRDVDGDTVLVTVLGTDIIVERTGTVFKGVTFAGLAIGDLIEVSGFADAQGRLRATRIEKREQFRPGVSEIEVKGVVSGLAGSEFSLRGFTVDFAAADLGDVPGGELAEGMQVEVEGTLEPETGRITASKVELESGVAANFSSEDEVNVQGFISDYVSVSRFRVNGVSVDASNASLRPPTLALGNEVVVEVEGSWQNGILQATRIEGRRGRVKVEAEVAAVDGAGRTVTLQLHGGRVTVQVDSRTMLDDETDRVNRLSLADIRTGDFLDIEAYQLGDGLVATRIDRDEADDDVLQAPLDGFVAETGITALGISYDTAGAEFRSLDDQALTRAGFFAALKAGILVKIRDEAPADGIADRVELEYAASLDGEREFDREETGGDGQDDDSVDQPDEPDEADSPDEADEDAGQADEPDEVDSPDEPDEVDSPDEPDEVDSPDEPDEVDSPDEPDEP